MMVFVYAPFPTRLRWRVTCIRDIYELDYARYKTRSAQLFNNGLAVNLDCMPSTAIGGAKIEVFRMSGNDVLYLYKDLELQNLVKNSVQLIVDCRAKLNLRLFTHELIIFTLSQCKSMIITR